MSEKDLVRPPPAQTPVAESQNEQLLTTARVQTRSSGIVYLKPERLASSAWIEHIPFAFWVVAALRPCSVVELGVHRGVSYCAFCQAVKAASFTTKCYAIDDWRGDEHGGHFGSEVFGRNSNTRS